MSFALVRRDGSILDMRGLAPDHSNIQCFLKREPTPEELAAIVPLVDNVPAHDPATHVAEPGPLAAFAGRVECAWTARPLTTSESTAPGLARIAELELAVTPRRLREAALGDRAFVADIDAKIKALRGGLKK